MNKFFEALHIALANLIAHATRSGLSILGIVIGIGSVIAILSISAGAKKEVLQRFNALGVNVYTLYPEYDQKTARIGHFEPADITNLENLSFVVTAFPHFDLNEEIRTRQVVIIASIKGAEPSYLKAKNLEIVQGRNFSPLENENRAPVCLLNEDSINTLFPQADAVGETLYVFGSPWKIVGTYQSLFRDASSRLGGDQAVEVLLPLQSLIRSGKSRDFDSIEVHVQSDYKGPVKKDLQDILERNDPNRKGLFRVWDQQEYVQQRLNVDKLLTLIVTIVACISLLVGGIGMMNVMLTSVAERTREIGVRRAVGARKKDILYQFLIESCVLSALGGLFGLVLGVTLAQIIPQLFNKIFAYPAYVKPSFSVLAMTSAMLLGVVFGLFPAIKASKLSAAEALRTE